RIETSACNYSNYYFENYNALNYSVTKKFEEVFLTKREEYEKLLNDGALMFQQVPLVDIDGMQLVQSKAILNYIAGKYSLYGKDLKERAMIDMYSEGIGDLMDLFIMYPFTPPENKQKHLSNIEQKAKDRILPVFEKGLANSQFLVGNQLSRADVHLLEVTLMLQELLPTILASFPKIQVLHSFSHRHPTPKFLNETIFFNI
uniref:glutathione transferase n=1 Tax=Sinocyclocheilus rhinocerous TaxID=307959 RepID=A0A673GI85_9TELE